MANPEQLAMLRQGADVWNAWRRAHPDRRPDLRQAQLAGAHLSEANLSGADLYQADLSGTALYWANLAMGMIQPASRLMRGLTGPTFLNADLRGADLIGAHLGGADLSGADLSGANLCGADLSAAHLSGASLIGANLSEVTIGFTFLGDVNLYGVKGLDTVRYQGPSSIGIDTIYKCRGQLPDTFLRGCGVPEDFIAYTHSIAARREAGEYYSCVISYSSHDQDFAERLHADLQAKGIRVWFAPEDMKIGDRIRPAIDEAIKVYDKLLIVLSANSVQSTWVEKEVETAFDKERKTSKLVLFPIRLDDAVMETDQAWAADIRRQRNIGDFTRWKDRDAYQTAFDRLLRDLKASEAPPP